ncbi:competence/damage-inducible protein A [Thermodesulfobacteriota bacterium B35]
MIGEIIAIGDELTSGRIANTTSGFAARQLFAAGHEIYAMHTIGDTPELIGEALKRAIERVDFVIVTGGLGATTDDMTNEAVARALDRPPELNREILEKIRSQLQGTDTDPSTLEKLAWLPEGAEVLNAEARMAGYLLVHQSTPIFFLPGVPSQMKELLVEHVLPILAGWSRNNRNHVRQRVYRTFGLPESEINRLLRPLEGRKKVKIGYYPVDCEVHVSLTVLGASDRESDSLFTGTARAIEEALGDYIYGTDHETLASVTGRLLRDRNMMMSVAESCTGGLIGARITEVPGSSRWFAGGVIAYSNQLKEILLDVDHELLVNHGAVSGPVARAMAARLGQRLGTALTVSVTGIAGPSGGTPEKPVGTVYIGLLLDNRVSDRLYHFTGSRRQIQERTACTALDTIRRALLDQGTGDR